MPANKNKRSQERKNLIYFPQVFLYESNIEFGRIVDITVDGFMLVRSRAIESGLTYDLSIRWLSENNIEESWKCSAVSCWCKPDKNPELYAVGFQFKNHSQELKNDVTRLIRKWSFPEW